MARSCLWQKWEEAESKSKERWRGKQRSDPRVTKQINLRARSIRNGWLDRSFQLIYDNYVRNNEILNNVLRLSCKSLKDPGAYWSNSSHDSSFIAAFRLRSDEETTSLWAKKRTLFYNNSSILWDFIDALSFDARLSINKQVFFGRSDNLWH